MPTTASYPMATNMGARIMTKGRASSPMPNTAPPRENSVIRMGISRISRPFVMAITLIIPASTAPVRRTIPKDPPTTRIKAMMPTAVPFLSPTVIPSNTKFKIPWPPKSSVPQRGAAFVTLFPFSSRTYSKLSGSRTDFVFSSPSCIYVISFSW